jgi:hypothetical protein
MRTSTTAARLLGPALAVVAALAVAACSDDGATGSAESSSTAAAEGSTSTVADGAPVIDPGDGGNYDPGITAADFVAGIDNPYLPLTPGSRWVYEGSEDGEDQRIEVVVTDRTRQVMGVTAVVVQDTVTSGGEVVEDTEDWFAQDRDGNVWYLGEATQEFDGGQPTSSAGSWEAGVDGAQPGLAMPAAPSVGQAYRQEFLAGEAEDLAEVLRTEGTGTALDQPVDHVVTIREWTPLEPDVVEEKGYAPGIGQITERTTAGGDGEFHLVEYHAG